MAMIPTMKIKGKHKLDQIIRDIHAGYGKRISIPLDIDTEQLAKESSVDVIYEKKMGKRQGYYRYYYYKAYSKMKPSARIAIQHPVMMQRKHKRSTRP